MKTDGGYSGDHLIANGLGYLTEIKPGMTIKYDIYNEAGDKLYEMTFQMQLYIDYIGQGSSSLAFVIIWVKLNGAGT